ncbi:MAG: hypothetical protein RR140_01560 [Clostridia bacterium]
MIRGTISYIFAVTAIILLGGLGLLKINDILCFVEIPSSAILQIVITHGAAILLAGFALINVIGRPFGAIFIILLVLAIIVYLAGVIIPTL